MQRYPDDVDSIELCLEPEPKPSYHTMGGHHRGAERGGVSAAARYYNDIDPQVGTNTFKYLIDWYIGYILAIRQLFVISSQLVFARIQYVFRQFGILITLRNVSSCGNLFVFLCDQKEIILQEN